MAYRGSPQDEDAEVGALLEAEVFAIVRAWAEAQKQAGSRPAPSASRIRRR